MSEEDFFSVPRTLTIKFSLVEESKKRTSDEIINEVLGALSDDEFVIPWCEKIEKIFLDENK
ncbi:MAG: hypothetical protein AC479_01760 [miscellaneous Crenarchaeota group-6 archaeon AD8-1]|nr:MAG: hypothetical protein AC479_01760 [miscellaneous Crenarchaeota group-6 archaeon AD8-1]